MRATPRSASGPVPHFQFIDLRVRSAALTIRFERIECSGRRHAARHARTRSTRSLFPVSPNMFCFFCNKQTVLTRRAVHSLMWSGRSVWSGGYRVVFVGLFGFFLKQTMSATAPRHYITTGGDLSLTVWSATDRTPMLTLPNRNRSASPPSVCVV